MNNCRITFFLNLILKKCMQILHVSRGHGGSGFAGGYNGGSHGGGYSGYSGGHAGGYNGYSGHSGYSQGLGGYSRGYGGQGSYSSYGSHGKWMTAYCIVSHSFPK